MKVTVLYFENGTPRTETLEFDIVKMTKNSVMCKAQGSFLNYLVSDKDAETFFIHRNVFNSLTNNSICQIIEKDFGIVGGRSIWLATFKTM